MMRAAECRDIEKCYTDLVGAGKITQDDVIFIKECLEIDSVTPCDSAASTQSAIKARIARLHSIVASKLNVADSA